MEEEQKQRLKQNSRIKRSEEARCKINKFVNLTFAGRVENIFRLRINGYFQHLMYTMLQ